MKIYLGVVDFHGNSEALAGWIECGKRNSILRQTAADLPGQAKASEAPIRQHAVAKIEIDKHEKAQRHVQIRTPARKASG
jgi:hypothetical protein